MLQRIRHLVRRDHALHLAALQLGLVTVLSATLAIAAAPPPQSVRLARATNGEVMGDAFERLTRHMDPAMLSLAGRYTPAMGEPLFGDPVPLRGLTDAATLVSTEPGAADAGAEIRLQDLSPEAARIWNASNPIAALPNPAAKPFKLNTTGVFDEARAVDCMTAAIYYEAAQESTAGQQGVAQVVLNRMRHPAFPKTVCGVVFQGSQRTTGCQFSFTCDGSLNRTPSEAGWDRARKVAIASLNGFVAKGVGNATHYHASYVAPYWSPSLVKVAVIGAHIFYRWTGSSGSPPAFVGHYAGGEASGTQIATVDSLARTPVKYAMTAMNEVTIPSADRAEEVTGRAANATDDGKPASESEVIETAQPQAPVINAQDLDWQGRPKSKGPPRVAMSRRMF